LNEKLVSKFAFSIGSQLVRRYRAASSIKANSVAMEASLRESRRELDAAEGSLERNVGGVKAAVGGVCSRCVQFTTHSLESRLVLTTPEAIK
jgi:hypothetical protein